MTNVADLCQRLSKLQIKHRVMYPKKQLMFKDIESRFECLQHVFKDFTWDDLDRSIGQITNRYLTTNEKIKS